MITQFPWQGLQNGKAEFSDTFDVIYGPSLKPSAGKLISAYIYIVYAALSSSKTRVGLTHYPNRL